MSIGAMSELVIERLNFLSQLPQVLHVVGSKGHCTLRGAVLSVV